MTSIMTEQSFSNSFDQYCTHESDFNNFHSFFGGLIKELEKRFSKWKDTKILNSTILCNISIFFLRDLGFYLLSLLYDKILQ